MVKAGKPSLRFRPNRESRIGPPRRDTARISRVNQDGAGAGRACILRLSIHSTARADSPRSPCAADGTGRETPRALFEIFARGHVDDGGFRDSAEIAKTRFPAYHHRPSAPTNLTLHQAIEINVPIGCGDAPVFPGDVILGDSDGVIVIPAHLADEIADEAFEMTAFEDFVTEEVRKGRGIFGLYPATDEQTLKDFAAWRKKMGR